MKNLINNKKVNEFIMDNQKTQIINDTNKSISFLCGLFGIRQNDLNLYDIVHFTSETEFDEDYDGLLYDCGIRYYMCTEMGTETEIIF